MVTEEFKDIRGFEGMYMVSRLGEVKRVSGVYKNKYGDEIATADYVLPKKKNKLGYYTVVLFDSNNERREFLIHKLVASAFNPRVEGLYSVCHIDGDKLNNNADNLQWCEFSKETRRERVRPCNPLIDVYISTDYNAIILKKGNEILRFKSLNEVSKKLNVERNKIISAIKRHKRLYGWGVFGYKYANEELIISECSDDLVGS